MTKKNHYELLKVKPGATQKEIKHSYQEQKQKLKSKSSKNSRQKLKAIEDAYNILSDKSSRKAYDKLHLSSSDMSSAPKAESRRGGRPRPHRPISSALSIFWRHKWLWLRIGIVAMLVDWLFIFFTVDDFELGQGLWRAMMVSVLFWVAIRLSHNSAKSINARQAFYHGPHALIKQFLILFFWMLCLLGFVVGTLYFELVAVGLFFPTQIELAAATGLMLLLGLIGFYLVLRTIFSTVIIQEASPIESIKRSWAMTRGRAWWLTLRLVGGLVIALLPLIIIYLILYASLALEAVTEQFFYIAELFAFSGLSFVLTLPILVTVIDQLYEHEKPRKSR